ncbi:glycosyltransferase family 2 protein [Candidatus Symbiobacter mobilis]|uniref:Cell wall biogenesis glycosyltransferase n=1 Tax=Candidatus Symbiobacter mobilis CR TaxID=946483 RepID=U5N7T6_9BURK|nr:glycosyltransferase family A protein [Candidatus Symbiobacter mobilis]AGX87447.1 cell wall biogenesis glycosyltransferase [Candidatus Symbiobacter mobilis CR]
MHISLVLATVHRRDDVVRMLDSLVQQTEKGFDVILVDQNPDDRLSSVVERAVAQGLTIQHVRMTVANLSQARNLGLRHAQGDVVGFPDDDCWYEPDTVAQIRRAFADRLGLGGVVAQWVEQAQARGKTSVGTLSLQAWRRFRGGDASSISLFLRRELLDGLKGFDERLGVGQWYGCGEETDLVLRALSAGACIEHIPQARVHHLWSATPSSLWSNQCQGAYIRGRGAGALYAKHRLGAWVVWRGLLAPVCIPLLRGQVRTAVVGACTALGRLEGWLRWMIQERGTEPCKKAG